MTIEERAKVERLAQALGYEIDPQSLCCDHVDCPVCAATAESWDRHLWQLYNALIEANIGV